MKNLILFIILSFVSTIIFVSCAEDENASDHTSPTISEVSIGSLNDTIINDGVTLHFNRGDNRIIDTILIGQRIQLTARFRDNQALSSYFVKMRIDSGGLQRQEMGFGTIDTCLDVSRAWVTIFGHRDTTIIRQNDIIVPDSLSKNVDGVSKNLQFRESLYYFDFRCIDKAGNEAIYVNPRTNNIQQVYMVSRRRLIEILNK